MKWKNVRKKSFGVRNELKHLISSLSSYDAEQKKLNQMIDSNTNKIIKLVSSKQNIKDFMKVIKKYTEIKELDLKILNEFIEKIFIHEVKKEDHIRKQQINVNHKFIGKLTTE